MTNEKSTQKMSNIDLWRNVRDNTSNQKVLVIHDCLTAFAMAQKNEVYYITDDVEQKNWFKRNVINNIHFGNDDRVELIDNWLEIDTLIKEKFGFGKNMKFDLVIGNPPYEGNGLLYLKILEKVREFSIDKNVIWLCPSNFCDTIENKFGKIAKTVKDYNLITFIDVGNPFEHIALENVSIFHFNENGNTNLNEAWARHYSNKNLAIDVFKQIKNYNNHIYDKNIVIRNCKDSTSRDITKTYFVGTNNMGTREKHTKEWGTILVKDRFNNLSNKVSDTWYACWEFNTKEEALNFIEYTKSPIAKFAFDIIHYNYHRNENLKYIPWLNDYTKHWSDDMICEELGLSSEQYNFICKEMAKYK